MARNVISNTTVNVNINGAPAIAQLDRLRKKAGQIKAEIQAMETGAVPMDRRRLSQLYQDFQNVSRQISQCQNDIGRVNDVMRRLNTASPRELMSAMRTLKSQLNALQRDSQAWENHRRQIQLLEQELRRVNATLAIGESRWQRMNRFLNDTQTFFMGLIAAMAGFIQAGRKSVSAFADMEEALANTRKFTGLADKQVRELNDSFKKMDSRIAREQLNALAQEGGRLGKNTQKAVKDYVEAAAIINVALVDLGEGATQEIAKIANIFGDEKRLGTKQAMLSIGSAVNVLSQNCTASKPYLVEFTKRMAGIGSQAGLTVPQILAFGAVLDANGQKVEMSATAIQKIIMALANKNKEFSRVLGLDAEVLAATLKKSAKEGLMMYLEAIKNLSDKTSAQNATIALAPLFKDMGMDAARVATVLATLANHMGELKWQFSEADKAFKQATSATREYEIFNNTAQASIDKAKQRVHELAVELGEKLFPLMKHIYTSSSVFLRMLSQMINFISNNAGTITYLTAVIAAYTVSIYAATIKTAILTGATKALTAAKLALSAVAAIAKSATLAYMTVCELLTLRLNRARAAFRLLGITMKASPWGMMITFVGTLILAITKLKAKTDEFSKKIRELQQYTAEYGEEVVKEQKQLDRLIGTLKVADKSSKEYLDAKKQLISQYKAYLGGLINEKGEIINLAEAYDILSEAVSRSIRKRAISAQQNKIEEAYVEQTGGKMATLETSLRSYGATPLQVQTVLAAVSQAVPNGSKLSKDAQKILEQLKKNSPTLDNNTGKQLSGAQIWWGLNKMTAWSSRTNLKSPTEIIEEMEDEYRTYINGIGRIKQLNPALGLEESNLKQSDLNRLLKKLDDIIEGKVTKNIWLPKEFMPETEATTEKHLTPLMSNAGYKNPLMQPETGLTQHTIKESIPEVTVSRLDKDIQILKDQLNQEKITLTQFLDKREKLIRKYEKIPEGSTDTKAEEDAKYNKGYRWIMPQQAEEIKKNILREMRLAKMTPYAKSNKTDHTDGDTDFTYVSEKELEKQKRKEAAEARKEAMKAKAEYRQGLENIKAEFEQADAEIVAKYAAGEIDYVTYLQNRMNAEQNYCDRSREYMQRHLSAIKGIDVTEDKDYQAMMQRRETATAKYTDKIIDFQDKSISRREAAEIERIKKDEQLQARYAKDTLAAEIKRQDEITRITVEALEKRLALYTKGSEKWEQIVQEIEQKRLDGKAAKNRAYEERAYEIRKQYEKVSVAERLKMETAVLTQLLMARKISFKEYLEWRKKTEEKYRQELPGANSESVESRRKKAEKEHKRQSEEIDKAKEAGLITDKEADSRKKSLVLDAISGTMEGAADKFGTSWLSTITQVYIAFADLWQHAGDGAMSFADKMQLIGNVAAATFAAVSEGMKLASEFAQANAEIEIAKVEKRYEREKELAQGNTAITTALEQERQDKIAEIKNKAQNAAFSMQVIQAIGQSIIGAINAYTSTAAIPIIGPTLAPAAAAVALAAGVANVALLKKQAEASKAQGYAQGGYTPKGRRHDVAGVVHAGEWVASQDLVNNPEAAAVIKLLERAQRSGDVSILRPMSAAATMARQHNYVGSLSFDDASRVVATVSAARAARASEAVVSGVHTVNNTIASAPNTVSNDTSGVTDNRLTEVLDRLSKRLDEPFETINTITGPQGLNNTYRNYNKLINNKKRYS